MCLIIDTNVFGAFLANCPSQDMQCIHDWLTRRGKLVMTREGKYGKECKKYSDHTLMKAYAQNGQIKICNKQKYLNAEKKVKCLTIKSDDPHVLALAIAGGVKTLYSNDIDLGHDFKTLNLIKGTVYQNRKKQRPNVVAEILRNSPPC